MLGILISILLLNSHSIVAQGPEGDPQSQEVHISAYANSMPPDYVYSAEELTRMAEKEAEAAQYMQSLEAQPDAP